MAAALSAAHLDARAQARERAHALDGRLRWAIFAMTLLNGAVWGSMIAADRGVIDVHGLVEDARQQVEQAWSRAPSVRIVITSR
jgi:hypothetical protein